MESLFDDTKIKVYALIDESGNIKAVNSSIFLKETYDWIEIDAGEGNRYAHAQMCYFDKSLTDENGIYRYKYTNEEIKEKTIEEIRKEAEVLTAEAPTEIELLKAQLKVVNERNDFLEDCIAEMAMMVYQ